jgi:hypothetical protein
VSIEESVAPKPIASLPATVDSESGAETISLPGVPVVCPDCCGNGVCHICRKRDGFWEAVRSVFAGIDWLLREWESWRGYNTRCIEDKYIRPKVCVGCNGNRKCFKCRGTGTYTGE